MNILRTANLIGDRITLFSVGVYILLAILYAIAHRWPKCLYFTGAAILTIGVLLS